MFNFSCLIFLFLLTSFTQEKKTTIFIIGDSTAAKKDLSTGSPERGWGMALQDYFTSPIVVDNHAVNGRSSLSFYNEGRWAKVLEKLQPGDYVIIQFGHNDEKPSVDRHTEAHSTFQWMLASQLYPEGRWQGRGRSPAQHHLQGRTQDHRGRHPGRYPWLLPHRSPLGGGAYACPLYRCQQDYL